MTLTKMTQYAVATLIALVIGGNARAFAGGSTADEIKSQIETLKEKRAAQVVQLDETTKKLDLVQAQLTQLQLSGAGDRATLARIARLQATLRELGKMVVAIRAEIADITAQIERLESILQRM